MKIAVTSASGKLGARIVKQLVTDLSAEQVVAIARNTEKARSLGVEVRQGKSILNGKIILDSWKDEKGV